MKPFKTLQMLVIVMTLIVGCTPKSQSEISRFSTQPVLAGDASDVRRAADPSLSVEGKFTSGDSQAALSRQCVIDLCGSAEGLSMTQAQGPFGRLISMDVKQFLDKKVDPQIKELLRVSNASLKLRYAEMARLSKTTYEKQFSTQSLAMMAIFTVTSRFQQIIKDKDAFTPVNGGMGIQLNERAVQKQFPSQDSELVAKLVKITNLFLISEDAGRGQRLSSLTYDQYLQYSKGGVLASQMQIAYRFIIDIEEIKEKLGPFVFRNLDTSLMTKMFKNASLTESEKKEVMSVFSRTYSLRALVDQGFLQEVSRYRLDGSQLLKLAAMDKVATDVLGMLNNPQALDKIQDKALAHCRESVVKAIAAAPSELRLRKANELLGFVKAAAMISAENYFKGEALKGAQSAIQLSRFTQPRSSQKIHSDLEETIAIMLKEKNTTKELIQNFLKEGKNVEFLVAPSFLDAEDEVEKVFIEPVKSLCEKIAPPSFEDKALTSIGEIQMGWQTVSFSELGAGIMAHEIGHIISAAVTSRVGNERYAQAKTCSRRVHAQITQGKAKPEQYDEEDWADVFAASTMKELQKNWPYAKNYACALISFDEKAQYDNLDLHALKGIAATDSHSMGLFRALKVHAQMGNKIPESCTKSYGPEAVESLQRSCEP